MPALGKHRQRDLVPKKTCEAVPTYSIMQMGQNSLLYKDSHVSTAMKYPLIHSFKTFNEDKSYFVQENGLLSRIGKGRNPSLEDILDSYIDTN